MDSIKTNDQNQNSRPETSPFYSTHLSSFSTPGAYITHSAAGGSLADYVQRPLGPQKALYLSNTL